MHIEMTPLATGAAEFVQSTNLAVAGQGVAESTYALGSGRGC